LAVNTASRIAAVLVLSTLTVHYAFAQKAEVVTIKEPGRIELSQLFKVANIVAIVRIVSGDTENYEKAMYKADVVRSFKGTSAKETLYVGPYEGLKLGGEYFLFLQTSRQPAAPKNVPTAMYGTVRYSNIFNEGYSSMAASYDCVFDGDDVAKRCDDGIRVCTDYIILPQNIRTFPAMDTETPFGCRLVRRKAFESLVEQIAGTASR
jgi:hypothetical protein